MTDEEDGLTDLSLTVNGKTLRAEVEDRYSLTDVLRDVGDLTGTHLGCEQGVCGACTVLIDGMPVRSCLLLAGQCEGLRVTTVEGRDVDPLVAIVQDTLVEENALQCGFCTPGFVMLLAGLLHMNWSGDDHELAEAMSANICRCTGYAGLMRAGRRLLAREVSDKGGT